MYMMEAHKGKCSICVTTMNGRGVYRFSLIFPYSHPNDEPMRKQTPPISAADSNPKIIRLKNGTSPPSAIPQAPKNTPGLRYINQSSLTQKEPKQLLRKTISKTESKIYKTKSEMPPLSQ